MAQPWVILTAPERQAVGAFIRELNASSKKDAARFRRIQTRYRTYCEYLGEQKRLPEKWVDELYFYGLARRGRKKIEREPFEPFEQMRFE